LRYVAQGEGSMTKDEALQMCLEYIETDAHERKYVRHAIKAALEAKDEPHGWKLVPIKPTDEMLKAMDECSTEGYDERLYAGYAASVYMAAVDVAPSPSQQHAGDLAKLGWQYFECPACGSEGARAFSKQKAKDEPVANNWSVFNTGAEVWDKLSLADAVVELTPSRLERGWSAVCVINKDNPPLYTTPPKQEAKDEPVSRKKPYLDKGADYEHGFIDGMQYQMQSSVDKAVNAMSQRKPLTDDEITLIIADCASSHQHTDIHLARAIEAAHGIKDNT
jgi:hypothetical protein